MTVRVGAPILPVAWGVDPREEHPVWRWYYAGEAANPFAPPVEVADTIRLGEEIPLARFRLLANGPVSEPDLTLRRNAQGLVRPHIASGRLEQGSMGISGSFWRWTATIDTAGGFNTATPSYFVCLADHPLSPTAGFGALLNADQRQSLLQRALGPFVSVQNPTWTSLTLDVRMALPNMPEFQQAPSATMRSIGLTLPVAVNWLGLEPVGGCPPTPLPLALYLYQPLPFLTTRSDNVLLNLSDLNLFER